MSWQMKLTGGTVDNIRPLAAHSEVVMPAGYVHPLLKK